MIRADIVIPFSDDLGLQDATGLCDRIRNVETDGGVRLFLIDSRDKPRSTPAASNLGAFHPEAKAPVVGFLEPATEVHGPFVDQAISYLHDRTVLIGTLPLIDASDVPYVMFVKRAWLRAVGGFDIQFMWQQACSDLIMRATSQGESYKIVKLPLTHAPMKPPDGFELLQSERRLEGKWK